MLHVVPDVMEPAEAELFPILICNFPTTPCRMPKHIALATGVTPPTFIVGIEKDEDSTATLSNEAGSTIAAVHYKLKRNRAEQMERNDKVFLSPTNNSNKD